MPTQTYDLIASNVLTSNASSITFSSIPSTYRDLVLVASLVSQFGGGSSQIRLNSDAGSGNYSFVIAEGLGNSSGTGFIGSSNGFVTCWNSSEIGGYPTPVIYQFLDYSTTNKHKSILARANNVDSGVTMTAGRWANTSAITSIELIASLAANTRLDLYGIVS